MRLPFKTPLIIYLIFALLIISAVPEGLEAAFIPSEVVGVSSIDRAADLARIEKALEMKMVKQRLGALGLSQDEIRARIGQLSDYQIHQLSQNIDKLRVGGDDALGVIIALLVITILVVLILNLTGHKVVVK